MKKCLICENKFFQKNKSHIYCSIKCRSKAKYERQSLDKKKSYILNKKKRLNRKKEKLINVKGGSCSHCGYNKCFSALEFHHIGNDKEINISRLMGYSLEKILKELEKCILLCSNCHTKEHDFIQIKQDYRSKLRLFLIKVSGNKCSDCGENNINSLDFHHIHPEDKEFSISKAISHRWDVTKIIPELEKCNLFCRNCHREHHSGIRKIFKEIKPSEKELNNFIEKNAPKRTCRMCRKTFKGFSQKSKLCSKSCKNEYYSKGYINGYYLNCNSCGEMFNTNSKETFTCSKCISNKVSPASYKKVIQEELKYSNKYTCSYCSNDFNALIKRKYCSLNCQKQDKEIISSEVLLRYYKKYLNYSKVAVKYNMSINNVIKRLKKYYPNELKEINKRKKEKLKSKCKQCKILFTNKNGNKNKYCSYKCRAKAGLIREINHDQVIYVLEKNNFNVLKSSKDLNVPRTTLRDYIKKHKLKN